MHIRLRRLVVTAAVLFTAAGSLPAAAAPDRQANPSHDGLSDVIRYTEYGTPHILAENYADLGFGQGWAQAADEVCTLAEGFVTLRGERSRYFGADAAADGELSAARTNLTSDLYFRGVRESRTVEKLLAEPAPVGPSREVRDMMRGWAAGYNAWLKQNRITDPSCAGASWVQPAAELDVAVRGYAVAAISGEGRFVETITAAQPPSRAAGIPLDAKLGAHQFVVRGGQRIPVPGGSGRLGVWNVLEPAWNAAQDGYTEVPFGSSHLQAVGWDGSGCPVARTLLTYSQSSNPNSPHYSDQTRLFSGERWVTSRFCEKDILSSPKLEEVRVSENP